MALATSIADRKKARFVELSGGVAVRLVGIAGAVTVPGTPMNDLIKESFVENAAGDTAIRVIVS
jgi:hypothetical protein